MNGPEVVPGISEAVQEFVRSCGLDPAQTGDFTITFSVNGAVTGNFNMFLTATQLAKLRTVVEKDPAALRNSSQFNVTVFATASNTSKVEKFFSKEK